MIVLDACVVLKWAFDDEPRYQEAMRFLEKHQQGNELIHVPDLMPFEIGNALVYKKSLSSEDIANTLAFFFSTDLQTHPSTGEDCMGIAELARHHGISFYDASYVHLAQKLHCDLITADQKLFEKTKSLPFIRCL